MNLKNLDRKIKEMKEKGENKPKSSLTYVKTMEVAKINSRLTSL